jgi:hypothetical protein
VDPNSAFLFVFRILYLLAKGVGLADIVDADGTAFLQCPQGFHTWARRGTEAVQIHIAGNEKRSDTVMTAVKMDGRILPLFTLAKARQCDQSGCSNWILWGHTYRRTVLLDR